MKNKRIIKLISLFVILILGGGLLSSCSDYNEDKQRANIEEKSSAAFDKQVAAVDYPADELNDSLERRNIRERLLRTNKADKIGYVYYVPFGQILGYWTVKGKVSSVKSQMNPTDDLSKDLCGSGCSEHVITESAGDDGAFGENQDAVFFFTTNGTMIEVPEDDYFYSDQPITLGTDIVDLDQK